MKEAGAESGEEQLAAELVRRIKSDDRDAEGELVERYSRGLLFMLQRMTSDLGLADDLHQETFRIVLERLRATGLERPERLGGFIRRTARNLFIGDYRKKVRRQDGDFETSPTAADPRPGPLHHAILDEEAATVRRVLDELQPQRYRQILYRFYLLEEEKDRICTDLELSSLHFNRVLHRARQRFKNLMERALKSSNMSPRARSGEINTGDATDPEKEG